jgi:hypothetical protein
MTLISAMRVRQPGLTHHSDPAVNKHPGQRPSAA